MQNLIKGHHAFQANVFAKRREFFARLADGQAPSAVFIACSDSRFSPTLVTQTQPGELFELRNAGNFVPSFHPSALSGEAATLEFAVEVLKVQDIIVCGHSDCGAMHALLNPEEHAHLPALARWLEHGAATRQIIRESYGHLKGAALAMVTAQENVLVQLEHLRTHPAIAAAINRGKLGLHGWIYGLTTGEIHAYEPEAGQFQPIDGSRRES